MHIPQPPYVPITYALQLKMMLVLYLLSILESILLKGSFSTLAMSLHHHLSRHHLPLHLLIDNVEIEIEIQQQSLSFGFQILVFIFNGFKHDWSPVRVQLGTNGVRQHWMYIHFGDHLRMVKKVVYFAST